MVIGQTGKRVINNNDINSLLTWCVVIGHIEVCSVCFYAHTTDLTPNYHTPEVLKMTTAKKLPQPTGNIWKPDSKNPATVPISTKLVKTHIRGSFLERERKLWTFLVQAVWDELGTAKRHRLSLSEVNRVFRELGGRHESQWLRDYIRSIANTTIEYEGEDETAKTWMITNLISSARIIEGKGEEKGQDFIEFSFPPDLVEALKAREIFARLRPHLMISLSGKYSVTLYELLESVANQKYPIFKASVEDLRAHLAVPEGKNKRWADLHRYVIKPAVKELNKHSDDTGFTVSYDTVKGKKNKVVAIHFHVEKVASRIEYEQKIKKPEVRKTVSRLPSFSPRDYEIFKKVLEGSRLVIYDLESDWRREFEAKADTITNPQGHFTDYIKRREKSEKSFFRRIWS